MGILDYCLKYEYYREMLYSYHDIVMNSINATIIMYSFGSIDNMNMKYCNTILLDRYPDILSLDVEMDKKYSAFVSDVYLDNSEEDDYEELDGVIKIGVYPNEGQFKNDVNYFSEEVDEFLTYLMQLLEELALKKMFTTNPAILERLEMIFHRIHLECEEVEEYLQELKEDFG